MHYLCQLTDALDRALNIAELAPDFDINHGRMVAFSDLHRGARNRADEFVRCERTYLGALAHYFDAGFSLLGLGDLEDLWKERPQHTLAAHARSLHMEGEFAMANRYLRFWGNHDWLWQHPRHAQQHLGPVYRAAVPVRECLLLPMVETSGTKRRLLGRLLMLHGHQGTLDSGSFTHISRAVIRIFWRTWQLRTGWSAHPPAAGSPPGWHERLLMIWARTRRVTLLAGHTHRPRLRRRYLNTGSCSYADGSITGIEMAHGQALQVVWQWAGGCLRRAVINARPIQSLL